MSSGEISTFSDISIIVESESFFSGIVINGTASIKSKITLDPAISALLNIKMENNNITALIVGTETNSTVKIDYTSSFSLLGTYSQEENTLQHIIIKDSDGNIIWDNYLGKENVVLVNDTKFFITYSSSFLVFPLSYGNKPVNFHLKLSPSDKTFDIVSLLTLISDKFSKMTGGGNQPPESMFKPIETLQPIISSVSSFLNGGLIIIGEKDTLNIDGTEQEFKKLLLAKGDSIDISLLYDEIEDKKYASIKGESSIVFLGDHLYTSQAKESENGLPPTVIPIFIILLWIVAIIVFILFKFFIKREVNEFLTEKLKRSAFLIHIFLIIIAFILLDMEISYQFGISILSSLILLPQGANISLISLGIISGIQLTIWGISALIFALPIRAIVNSILSFFGIGKEVKGIGKGVGVIFIWIFGTIYLKIFANIFIMILLNSGFLPTNLIG
jgi:hypothetical protein